MHRFITCCLVLLVSTAHADPESDRTAFRDFYAKRFPDVALSEHKDGVYALDAGAREQWLELEDFPLYEIAVDEGAELFEKPFASGAGYATCFGDGAVKQNYPFFDAASSSVVTLEIAVNQCRATIVFVNTNLEKTDHFKPPQSWQKSDR